MSLEVAVRVWEGSIRQSPEGERGSWIILAQPPLSALHHMVRSFRTAPLLAPMGTRSRVRAAFSRLCLRWEEERGPERRSHWATLRKPQQAHCRVRGSHPWRKQLLPALPHAGPGRTAIPTARHLTARSTLTCVYVCTCVWVWMLVCIFVACDHCNPHRMCVYVYTNTSIFLLYMYIYTCL